MPVTARTKEARDQLEADFAAFADPHAKGTHIHRHPKIDQDAAKTAYAPMSQLETPTYGGRVNEFGASAVVATPSPDGFLQQDDVEVKPQVAGTVGVGAFLTS